MKPDGSLLSYPQDVEIHPRKYLTANQKQSVLEANPTCVICGEGFGDSEVEYDHRVPLALGGSNDLSNFCPLHPECHSQKTKEDMKRIAKAKRLEAKRKGSKRTKGLGGRGRKIPSRPLRKPEKTK